MVDLFDKYDIYYWTSYQLYSFYNLPKNTAIVIACRINKKNPPSSKNMTRITCSKLNSENLI